jgi:dipeptidase E
MMQLFLCSDFSPSIFPKLQARLGDIAGKKVLFIVTAALGEGYTPSDDVCVQPFIDAGATVESYDIAGKTEAEVREKLAAFDIISVSGGNTFYLLQHMNSCGFKGLLIAESMRAKTYIGSSAGSAVMSSDIGFIAGMDDPAKATLTSYEGLGLIDELLLPHADSAAADNIMKPYHGPRRLLAIHDDQIVYIPNINNKLMMVF